jgi:hypothetical protein
MERVIGSAFAVGGQDGAGASAEGFEDLVSVLMSTA